MPPAGSTPRLELRALRRGEVEQTKGAPLSPKLIKTRESPSFKCTAPRLKGTMRVPMQLAPFSRPMRAGAARIIIIYPRGRTCACARSFRPMLYMQFVCVPSFFSDTGDRDRAPAPTPSSPTPFRPDTATQLDRS